MARRNDESPAEIALDIFAKLPWWVGASVGVVAYFVLHHVANREIVVSMVPGQVVSTGMQAFWKGLAIGGQYILPLLAFGGAALSAWKRYQRRALIANVSTSEAANALNGMSWQEFEMLVGEAFRLKGFQVIENDGPGADGGVDLVLRKTGETFLVQCKQWKAYKVGVQVVRELYGVMAARGATGGFVVTSGRFTDEATAFADGRNLKLIDGLALQGLIRRAQASRAKTSNVVPPKNTEQRPMDAVSNPACPVCSKSMVRRTAKRGANAGGAFWGCSGYPVCKGTRTI